MRCLDAIAAERAALPFETEVLVLDNASTDGSAGAARRHPAVDRGRRARRSAAARARTTATLLQRARGRFCLLLNEDSELRPGATAALHAALTERRPTPPRPAPSCCGPTAACSRRRGASRRRPPRWSARCSCTSRFTVQSRGRRDARASTGRSRPRCSCAATPPRHRLVRPAVLRLLRRGRLLPAPAPTPAGARCGSGRRGDPPRAALDRRGARAAHRRAVAQPRPLHAQAPLRRAPPGSCGC